jgi:N6-L-threonylcarbamoyladenine synthase
MKILAIETSCDDTGIALIESDKAGNIKILANLVSSQIETHKPYGGVVPNLAKREHQKALPILFNKLTKSYKLQATSCDLIAVTQGPGLAPCLWTGVNFAKDLAIKLNKPIVGINHLKGHIFAALLDPQISNFQFLISKKNPDPKPYTLNPIPYPLLALIVSGGHTQLVFSKKLGHYKIIGETLDDAAGEAFDKVAKLIGLEYPGGPEISKRAENGNPTQFDFPRPMINSKDFDFSFSGLKTSVLYLVKGLYAHSDKKPLKLTNKNIADLCASFQQAVTDVLVSKTILATKILKPKTLILGGGVAANKHLRETLKSKIEKEFPSVKCLLSPENLTGDNALMIAMAALAEYKLLKSLKNVDDLKADPNLRLD